MVRRTKNKSIKLKQKKNNVFRFSAISIFVIFSFFSLPTFLFASSLLEKEKAFLDFPFFFRANFDQREE